jgi:CRISPR/Cas system Type II protein with McrA/HNH and RuvC-like nuclease domain
MELFYIPGNMENNLLVKNWLVDSDGSICVYCGKEHDRMDKELTIDHVIPQVSGGSNRLHNLVLCCATCNQVRKANKGVKNFKELANFIWQSRRNRELKEKKRRLEILPTRVLYRLPLEIQQILNKR